MLMMARKICTRCKIDKPLCDFSDHPAKVDGKQSQCKDCFAERARLKRVGKPCITCGKPKEQGTPRGAKICLSCSTTCFVCKKNPRREQHRSCRECQNKSNKVSRDKPENKHKQRIRRIVLKYKITKEFAEKIETFTHCMVCEKEFISPRDRHIDHCHSTHKVRGVLCFNCNASLGHLNDNPERLIKLIGYLAKHQNGREDLDKAIHVLELLRDMEYPMPD